MFFWLHFLSSYQSPKSTQYTKVERAKAVTFVLFVVTAKEMILKVTVKLDR